jgi:hypothetical protein
MQLPERLPGLKWITILWGLYTVIWAMLESGLWPTILLAILSSVMFLGHLTNRVLGGKRLTFGIWLLLSVVLGSLFGLGSALLTVILMILKTGLHAHGPEFSALEINWIVQQIPWWTLGGMLGGLGLGLLLRGMYAQGD